VKVWIGLQHEGEFVHEWTGEITEEGGLSKAVKQVLDDYKDKPDSASLFDMNILVGKAPRSRS